MDDEDEFENEQKLQGQIDMANNDLGNLNCKECDKKFESIKSVKGHIKLVHSYDPIKCPICQIEHKNVHWFRNHLKSDHKIVNLKKVLALIKEVKPEFKEVKRRKKRNDLSHEKNLQDSYNKSEHQKKRSDLVNKWKEIKKERDEKAQKMNLNSDEINHNVGNVNQDIKLENDFILKSEAMDDGFEKNNEPKVALSTQTEKCKCSECGKSFSASNKLNSHIKIVHTYEPCICPFCGTKTLKNKAHLAKHIRKAHADFKKPKEEMNTFNEEEKVKLNQVLINDTAKMRGPSNVKQNIAQELGLNIFEPCPCPFCEGTILKNKIYLMKHMKQFHKDYTIPGEGVNNVHKEEETTLSQDPLNRRIGADQNSEEIQDLKLEPDYELGNLDVKPEVAKQFDYVMEENKDSPDEDLNNSKIKREKSFICDICGKGFEMNCLLIRHKWVHGDVKPICCDSCPKTFTSNGALNYHKLSHTNEKPFMCETCSQTFTTKHTFQTHKLIHSGEKPFQCGECEQSFRRKDFMKMHQRKFHTTEKPYMCDICTKTFVSKFKYEEHKRIHTGEKPYQCDECEASFRLKFVLQKHKKLIHGPQVLPICPLCGKSFEKKMALGGHMATAHPSEKQSRICFICNKEFKNASGLIQHQKKCTQHVDEQICEECGKTCKSKRALYDHTRSTHRKDQYAVKVKKEIESSQTDSPDIFKCVECGKEFTKERALYNHNYHTHRIENVDCPNCGKTCKNKVVLRRHIKRSACVSAQSTLMRFINETSTLMNSGSFNQT